MDVNLSYLKPWNDGASSKPPTGHSSKLPAEVSDEDQWKFYINKSLKNVCSDLLRDDENRTFYTDKESIFKILERRA